MDTVYTHTRDISPITGDTGEDREGLTDVPNAVLKDPGLSMQAKFLYVELLSRSQEGSPSPSQVQLAESIGRSTHTVRKYLQELKDAGLLTTQRRWQEPNLYMPVIRE